MNVHTDNNTGIKVSEFSNSLESEVEAARRMIAYFLQENVGEGRKIVGSPNGLKASLKRVSESPEHQLALNQHALKILREEVPSSSFRGK